MNGKLRAKQILKEIVRRIRNHVNDEGERPFKDFPSVKLATCYLAEEDHAKEKRVYAHTIHKRNTVCVAEDFFVLTKENQRGILFHEAGHLFLDIYEPEDGDDAWSWMTADEEINADLVAEKVFGVRIVYDEFRIQAVHEQQVVQETVAAKHGT